MATDSPTLLNSDTFKLDGLSKTLQREETLARTPEPASPYLRSKNLGSTDSVFVVGNYVVRASHRRDSEFTATTQAKPPTQAQPARRVNGTIVLIEDGSVVCELELTEGPRQIRLARGIFPEEITYGTPIQLRVDDVNGVRRPIVEIRAPDRSRELEAIKARVDMLISDL